MGRDYFATTRNSFFGHLEHLLNKLKLQCPEKKKKEGGKSGKEDRRERESEAHVQSKGSIGLNIWVFFYLVPVAGDNIFSGGFLS